jgi:hypothetical protein
MSPDERPEVSVAVNSMMKLDPLGMVEQGGAKLVLVQLAYVPDIDMAGGLFTVVVVVVGETVVVVVGAAVVVVVAAVVEVVAEVVEVVAAVDVVVGAAVVLVGVAVVEVLELEVLDDEAGLDSAASKLIPAPLTWLAW